MELAPSLSSTNKRMQLSSCFSCNTVEDILSRLDVKALTRFKGVSKVWLQLISSPPFQDLHYSRSQRNLHLFFRSPMSYETLSSFTYQLFSCNIGGNFPRRSRFPLQVDKAIIIVLPSCRGLFCFATLTHIYVYNPATVQLLALPPFFFACRLCGFGIGYMASAKCYTVVRLLYRRNTGRIDASVVQLRHGTRKPEVSWRLLAKECPYSVQEFSLPASAGGTIYWKINRSQGRVRNDDDILCFDIEEEAFSAIPYPTNWRISASDRTQLVNFDGTLSMVCVSASKIVIWVHKDNQWQRRHAIDCGGDSLGNVHYMKDGEIIFASLRRHYLLFVDPDKRIFKMQKFPCPLMDIGIYSESLFPLRYSG